MERIIETLIFNLSNGIYLFSFSKFLFSSIIPFFNIDIILIIPARPLAASRCPILVFTESITNGISLERADAIILTSAPASTGLPAEVPVP